MDFELVQSTNPEFNKALVRINITREHRQVVQVRDFLCYKSETNFSISIRVMLINLVKPN